jgi:hypothetical protein
MAQSVKKRMCHVLISQSITMTRGMCMERNVCQDGEEVRGNQNGLKCTGGGNGGLVGKTVNG